MKRRKIIIGITVVISFIIVTALGIGGIKVVNANKINSLLDLGIKYLTEGNYEEARLEFSKAISIDDKHEKATDLLALTKNYIELNELYANKEYILAADLISKIKKNKYLEYIESSVNEISNNIEAKIVIINEINNLDLQIQKLISENKFQEAIDLINKYLGEDLKQEYLDKLNELMNGVNGSKTAYEEENNNKNVIIDDSQIINILNEGVNLQEQYLFSSSNIDLNIKYKQGNVEYLMYIGNENNKVDILNKCKNYYSEETCNTILKLFIEVDGILYRRAGNGTWGERVITILNKEAYDNTIKLLLETITEGEKRQINATLKFENNKWVIDEYDALLVDKNWNLNCY